MSFLREKPFLDIHSGLERFDVENGSRSGGRENGRPRRINLKTTRFRRNDGSEIE